MSFKKLLSSFGVGKSPAAKPTPAAASQATQADPQPQATTAAKPQTTPAASVPPVSVKAPSIQYSFKLNGLPTQTAPVSKPVGGSTPTAAAPVHATPAPQQTASTQSSASGDVQALFQQAMQAHQQGQLDQARQAYQQVLASQPAHADALQMLGILCFQTGDKAGAVNWLSQAVDADPANPAALCNLGNVLKDMGDFDRAVRCYDRALSFKSDFVEVLNNRGVALRELRRLDDSLASFDQAVQIKNDYAEAYNNRASTLLELGRLDEAEAACLRAVELKPALFEAYTNRARILTRLQRLDEALAVADKAVELRPNAPAAWLCRAHVALEAGQWDRVDRDCDQALSLRPDLVDAHVVKIRAALARKDVDGALRTCTRVIELLPQQAQAYVSRAEVYILARQHAQALDDAKKAIELDPNLSAAYSVQARALFELKQREAALQACAKALALNPNASVTHAVQALALMELGRRKEALASFDRALALDPGLTNVWGDRLSVAMHLCNWQGLDEQLQRIEAGIRAGQVQASPFMLTAIEESPDILLKVAKDVIQANHAVLQPLPPFGAPTRHDKIRLGYFSADLHNHATTYLMAELFELHNKERFELIAFSFGPVVQDDMRKRVSAAFDEFIEVGGLSDAAVARLARDKGIDIAIDLKGVTLDSRPGIFMHRGAPIQVSYIGYPGSMGVDAFDYIVADQVVIPEHLRRFYSEKVVVMPHSYQVNDRKRVIDDKVFTRQEVGLPEQGFVFCCFNNNYKITPQVFDGWVRILQQVEGSVLWLLQDNDVAEQNLRQHAQARGLDPQRLIFAPRMALPKHLARQRLADLFIDTYPYTAHTTASDALWAGLPVLTRTGDTFPSRVAASLLQAVGLGELITETPQAYEALAVQLAREPQRLAQMKQHLASGRLQFPLFDTEAFTRHLESAYQTMYERYLAGQAPDHLVVNA